MQLRDQLRDLMQRHELSTHGVARALGIAQSTLSHWLKGNYQGNVDKIDQAVQGFLDRFKERMQNRSVDIPFVATSVAQRVFETARLCHIDGEIGVVYGDAGLGKTFAIREYAQRNSDVILVEVTPGYTTKFLFAEISRKLGMDTGSINEMFDDAVKRLQDSGRLIIIDEAEHLPYPALELLRRLHDKTGIGILLVGMPMLIRNLRGRRGQFTQLYSRVGIAVELSSLMEEDTREIVEAAFPDVNGVWKFFHQEAKGNARRLRMLIKRSARLAQINEVPIDATIVKEASNLLIK